MFSVPKPSEVFRPLPSVLPPAPEERRRKRLIRLAIFLTIAAAIAFAAWRVIEYQYQAELDAVTERALRDGTGASLEAALSVASRARTEEQRAVAGMLMAIGALEHGRPAGPAREALLGVGDDVLDAQIGRVYLFLEARDLGRAHDAATKIRDAGTRPAEAMRARALAKAAVGEIQPALEQAREAANALPDSPRHVTLLALLGAVVGDAPRALTVLDGLPRANDNPRVRAMRARLHLDFAGDATRGRTEAEAVLGPLRSKAAPADRAWAHLVLGRAAIIAGDSERAMTEARAAEEERPPGDELFDVALAETLFRAGAPREAGRVLERWTSEHSIDPSRRAQLRAELALDAGDLTTAEAQLADAAAGPRTDLLGARLADAKGEVEPARQGYEAAARDAGLFVEARRRQGALELAQGRLDRAVALLGDALSRSPGDPLVVPTAVRAHLARGENDRAAAIVADALARRADAPELLAARGEVEMAQRQWTTALATLRAVAPRRPEDADLQARLGEAAWRCGERDAAQTAFDATLRLNADHPRALWGKAVLAIDARDVEAARSALARVDAVRATGVHVDIAKARFALLAGMGERAIAEARRAAARAPRDGEMWNALGRLQLQAGRPRDAVVSFERALEIDPQDPEALTGRALVNIISGAEEPALNSIEAADLAIRGRTVSDDLRARMMVVRARIALSAGNKGGALRMARQALRIDARNGDAPLVLADLLVSNRRPPEEPLRAGIDSLPPMPEIWGRLALALPAGPEACDLGRRYLDAAERGTYADPVRQLVRGGCAPAP